MDSQKAICVREEQLPDTAYATYTTSPETGGFALVATAYYEDDSIYDLKYFEATQNMSSILDVVVANFLKNGPSRPIPGNNAAT